VSGNKIVYLSTIIIILFYYLGGGAAYLYKTKIFIAGFLLLIAVIPILDIALGEKEIFAGIVIGRMLFIPALLNFYYFDFFKDQPVFYSESHFFNRFFDYPYDIGSSFLISREYLGTTEVNSNNGILSDGFMNLGHTGVLLHIFVFVIIFLGLNSFRINSRYYGLLVLLLFIFVSAPLFSIFTTQGLLILFVFGFFGILSIKSTNK
jgi:hypothetical protein